jgi:hypothetical protein
MGKVNATVWEEDHAYHSISGPVEIGLHALHSMTETAILRFYAMSLGIDPDIAIEDLELNGVQIHGFGRGSDLTGANDVLKVVATVGWRDYAAQREDAECTS